MSTKVEGDDAPDPSEGMMLEATASSASFCMLLYRAFVFVFKLQASEKQRSLRTVVYCNVSRREPSDTAIGCCKLRYWDGSQYW